MKVISSFGTWPTVAFLLQQSTAAFPAQIMFFSSLVLFSSLISHLCHAMFCSAGTFYHIHFLEAEYSNGDDENCIVKS